MIPDLALIVTHGPVQFAQLILVRLLVILSGPRVSAVPLHDHHGCNKRVVGRPVRVQDNNRKPTVTRIADRPDTAEQIAIG